LEDIRQEEVKHTPEEVKHTPEEVKHTPEEVKHTPEEVNDTPEEENIRQKLEPLRFLSEEDIQLLPNEIYEESEQLIPTENITIEEIKECEIYILHTRPIASDIEMFGKDAKDIIYSRDTVMFAFVNLSNRIQPSTTFKELNTIIEELIYMAKFNNEIWCELFREDGLISISDFIKQYNEKNAQSLQPTELKLQNKIIYTLEKSDAYDEDLWNSLVIGEPDLYTFMEEYLKQHAIKTHRDHKKLHSDIIVLLDHYHYPTDLIMSAVEPQPNLQSHEDYREISIDTNINKFSFIKKGKWMINGDPYTVVYIESLCGDNNTTRKQFWVYYSDKIEIGIWRLLSINYDWDIYSGNNYETYEKTFINVELQMKLNVFIADTRIELIPRVFIPYDEIAHEDVYDDGNWKVIDAATRIDMIFFKKYFSNKNYKNISRKTMIQEVGYAVLALFIIIGKYSLIEERNIVMGDIPIRKQLFKSIYSNTFGSGVGSYAMYVVKITIGDITNIAPYFISPFHENDTDNSMWGVYSQYVRLPCNIYDLFSYSNKLDHHTSYYPKELSYVDDINVEIADNITYMGGSLTHSNSLYANYFNSEKYGEQMRILFQ
jgi:hypothetical protein